jgi:hypothetical protein
MKIMSTLLFLLLAVFCFFWMAETKVTFSPFTFEMVKLHKAIGFFLIIIGIWFIEYQSEKVGANKFKEELIKQLEELENKKQSERYN